MKTFNVIIHPLTEQREQFNITVQPGKSLAEALVEAGHGDVRMGEIEFNESPVPPEPEIELRVDGRDTTLSEFLRVNTQEPDVDHISPEDVDRVKALQPGQTLQLTLHSPEIIRLFDHVKDWLEFKTNDELDALYTETFGHKAYHMSREGYVRYLHPKFELCWECTGDGWMAGNVPCKVCQGKGFSRRLPG